MDLIEIGRIVAARNGRVGPAPAETPLDEAESRLARLDGLLLRQASLVGRMYEAGDVQGADLAERILGACIRMHDNARELWAMAFAFELSEARSAALLSNVPLEALPAERELERRLQEAHEPPPAKSNAFLKSLPPGEVVRLQR